MIGGKTSRERERKGDGEERGREEGGKREQSLEEG